MAATTYRTSPGTAAREEGSGALVVHCSDPRYQAHFHDFLRNGLGLDRYALLSVPGGVHALTLTEYLPKFSWVGWRWVEFLGGLIETARVVLIGHDDCRWYQDRRFSHLHGNADASQRADLRRVHSAIVERVPGAVVETWFARLDGDRAVFEQV
jgi:hypothetical protein